MSFDNDFDLELDFTLAMLEVASSLQAHRELVNQVLPWWVKEFLADNYALHRWR